MKIYTLASNSNKDCFKNSQSEDKSQYEIAEKTINEKDYANYSKAICALGMSQVSFGAQKIIIPVDDLKILIDKGLNTNEIAKQLGVSASKIVQTLKACGLKTQPQIRQELQQAKSDKLTKEILQKLVGEGKNTYEIAAIFGITSVTVANKLKEMGLKTNEQLKQKEKQATTLNITQEELQKLIDENKTLEEMAEIFGVSRATIVKKIKKFGLNSTVQEQRKLFQSKSDKITPEALQQCISQGKSTYQMAEIFGVSRQVICRRLKEYGLKTNTQMLGPMQSTSKIFIPKAELEKFIIERKKINEIAAFYGVSRGTIRNILEDYGLATELQTFQRQQRDKVANITQEDLQKIVNEGKTIAEIAKIYSVSGEVINAKLKQYGINTFKQIQKQSQHLKVNGLKKDDLEQYVKEGKSAVEIAKIYGVSRPTMYRKILEFNLVTNEQIQREKVATIKEDDLRILAKSKSSSEIALIYGISQQTVLNKLKQFGIQTKEQTQRERIDKITKDDILALSLQGMSVKQMCEKLKISHYIYLGLVKKFGIELPKNMKYCESQTKKYEDFSVEDLQNRLIELSECKEIITDEKLENLIDFICDKKFVNDEEKLNIINFIRFLDKINHGLIKVTDMNKSDEVKAIFDWKSKLKRIKNDFNLSLGTLYQNDESEVATVLVQYYSPNIKTGENISEAKYVIDLLKNVETQEDVISAKHKLIYFNENKKDTPLAKEAEKYSKKMLGRFDDELAGKFIYCTQQCEKLLNGENVKSVVPKELLDILKVKNFPVQVAVSSFIKLQDYFSFDKENLSINEFFEQFHIDDVYEKEIISEFVKNFYIKKDTKVLSKSNNGKEEIVIFGAKAKQEIYEAYPSNCYQILSKFENALQKMDADDKEAGIKKYKSQKGVLECKIKGSGDRLFALKNTLIFAEFDSSHKEKNQRQKFN